MVGIGSSAGGLAALKVLIAGLEETGRVSYVIAQHVSPTHNSLLVELLAPRTKLKIIELREACTPLADTVYVVPPNSDAEIVSGELQPCPPNHRQTPSPNVDRLFLSMASAYQGNAIGVLLSGTGSDGTIGMKAVKEAGGVALVQEPASAQYDGMPRSAIKAGVADLVLSPDRMGESISQMVGALGRINENLPKSPAEAPDSLNRIYQHVLDRTGVNLRDYKATTILRRINRRAAIVSKASLKDYADLIAENSSETVQLASDLSVTVTEFFRDGDAFTALRGVLERLTEYAEAGKPLRIWVPGCATGEEAYSIAILLEEIRREKRRQFDWIMFVTDMNSDSVAAARAGSYSHTSLAKLSDELVDRYFDRSTDGATVRKELRQQMVFATQNLIMDPPFSRLDLISCRNLLIYLDTEAQKKTLAAFHYSLREGRYLFLGSAETADVAKELFDVKDRKHRLYTRSDRASTFVLPQLGRNDFSDGRHAGGTKGELPRNRSIAERARDLICDSYAPPSVVINSDDRIVHFTGDLSDFVTLPRGPADWYVHDLVTSPISAEVRALVHRCRRDRQTVRGGTYTLPTGDQPRRVTPVAHYSMENGDAVVLLAFEASIAPAATEAGAETDAATGSGSGRLISELQSELASTREHLQTVVEEVETSNEELQTLNEELQSSNEELQSTNEELQTSNEELQSTNEELLTVNEELSAKSVELEVSRTDLVNVKESLDLPLLVVDSHLRLIHLNECVSEVVNGELPSVGEALARIRWDFDPAEMNQLVATVTHESEMRETTVTTRDGRWLKARVSPYRSESRDIRGAIITLLDMTREREDELRRAQRDAMNRLMVNSSTIGMVVTDRENGILRVNPATLKLLERGEDGLIGRPLIEFIHPDDARNAERALNALHRGRVETANEELRVVSGDGSAIWCSLSATMFDNDKGSEVLLQLQNITGMRNRQDRLAQERTQLKLLNEVARKLVTAESLPALRGRILADLAVIYDDLRLAYYKAERHRLVATNSVEPEGWPTAVGCTYEFRTDSTYARRLRGQHTIEASDTQSSELYESQKAELLAQGVLAIAEVPVFRDDALTGVLRMESAAIRNWTEFDLRTVQAVAELMSVAERDFAAVEAQHEAMQSLSDQQERMAVTLSSIGDGVITTDIEGQVDYMNPAAEEMSGWSRDEATGRSLFNIYRVIQGDTRRQVPNPVEYCLREGEATEQHELDLMLVRKSGEKVAVSHSAAPIRNQAGVLIGAILVFRDVSQTRMFTRELSRRATRDALTGLANRAEFERLLELGIADARRNGGTHVLMYIDLDRFKVVNDTAGHTAGDALLKEVSELTNNCLRQSDTLARIGGDEFAVLLERCSLSRAETIGQKIVDAIAGYHFEWQSHRFTIGASIGVAAIGPDASTITDAISRADAACYTAKNRGRNQVVIHDESDSAIRMQRDQAELLSRIGRAVEEDEFRFAMQSAVPAEAELPPYQEMLLRLPSDDGEPIPAERFLPTATRYGLLGNIDRWVVRTLLPMLPATRDGAMPGLVAINLSQSAIADLRFHDYLSRHIERAGVDASRLCLEVPEAAATEYSADLDRFVSTFSELGCRIALDDFGGGIGSFGNLKHLRLDYVKIGSSFIDGLKHDNIDRALIQAICQICHDIDRKVIACRVEDEAARDTLHELGVDCVQGRVNGDMTELEKLLRP